MLEVVFFSDFTSRHTLKYDKWRFVLHRHAIILCNWFFLVVEPNFLNCTYCRKKTHTHTNIHTLNQKRSFYVRIFICILMNIQWAIFIVYSATYKKNVIFFSVHCILYMIRVALIESCCAQIRQALNKKIIPEFTHINYKRRKKNKTLLEN